MEESSRGFLITGVPFIKLTPLGKAQDKLLRICNKNDFLWSSTKANVRLFKRISIHMGFNRFFGNQQGDNKYYNTTNPYPMNEIYK